MNGLRFAIGFLTILPVAPRNVPVSLASSRAYFPLVGLILGGILALIDYLWPLLGGATLIEAAILVVVLAVMTRALHLDGFMDSCDALLGGFTRERRLEILKDSHVGAFAVVGVVCLMLLKLSAILELPLGVRIPVLIIFPCLSRWGVLLSMEMFPYVRSQGLGTSFHSGSKRWQVIAGFVVALVAAILASGFMGLLLLVSATAVVWILGNWSMRLLGGVTGDIYGAINEVTEVVVLIIAVILATSLPADFISSPLTLG